MGLDLSSLICTPPVFDVLVLGKEGSGKSSLINMMRQVSTQPMGEIRMQGAPLSTTMAVKSAITTVIHYNGAPKRCELVVREVPRGLRGGYLEFVDCLVWVVDTGEAMEPQLVDLLSFLETFDQEDEGGREGLKPEVLMIALNKSDQWMKGAERVIKEGERAPEAIYKEDIMRILTRAVIKKGNGWLPTHKYIVWTYSLTGGGVDQLISCVVSGLFGTLLSVEGDGTGVL
jgi:energy-coupling factor transporter ATP-binding protein EcfA2